MTDLIRYLKSSADKIGDHLELGQLAPGDELTVLTTHTEYLFKIIEDRIADLTCSRFDRPHARVKIIGCTFGQSSSIKPDHLFCGGNLEFTYELDGVPMTHKTTAIKAIELRRRKAGDPSCSSST
jgi:hypothetical protein